MRREEAIGRPAAVKPKPKEKAQPAAKAKALHGSSQHGSCKGILFRV